MAASIPRADICINWSSDLFKATLDNKEGRSEWIKLKLFFFFSNKIPIKFIQIDDLYRHPTQLYEAALEGIVLLLILIYFWTKDYLKNSGKLSALFLIFYSIFRFIIEYFRTPDEHLGYLALNLTMGQLLSFLFFIAGFSLYYLKDDIKKRS